MAGVDAQAFVNEAEASFCIQVLQRRFPADQRDRAFAAERRPCAQDEDNPKHTPNPTHWL
jgi:hypothetical protein